ncbi:hypothetical protein [Pseudomonas citronellolis]|uniref:hypothetical protein n=1 Tax=Pseudomonas citronellolis TaxID=53408 RepID=UPI0022BA6822|nr:hypothetical protein [Pseudomonas citronellolis]WBG62201.1 hypothetical protein ELR50_04600 [Pseudomonas citronellolis]
MKESNSYVLLEQEGHLISSCLSVGLTALRKAHVLNKGEFYIALFNLSVGLERLMKATVIVDCLVSTGNAPTKAQLKNYGHDIRGLYGACVALGAKYGANIEPLGSLSVIDQNILQVLNDFAHTTRYHNLDGLSGAAKYTDPLECWNAVLFRIIEKDVSPRTISKTIVVAEAMAGAIKDKTLVSMTDLNKNSMSLEQVLAVPGLHDQAVRYAVLRLINIISPIRDLIAERSSVAFYGDFGSLSPLMGEFLEWLWNDRGYVLRKKRWP